MSDAPDGAASAGDVTRPSWPTTNSPPSCPAARPTDSASSGVTRSSTPPRIPAVPNSSIPAMRKPTV